MLITMKKARKMMPADAGVSFRFWARTHFRGLVASSKLARIVAARR
jgi:hypothetical protein